MANCPANVKHPRIKRLQRPNTGGSSGLFAVTIALDMGYDRIVLAGCPMEGALRVTYPDGYPGNCGEDKDGYHDPMPNQSRGFAVYQQAWTRHFDLIKDKTRSVSGWTQELLGAPTAEWIRSEHA